TCKDRLRSYLAQARTLGWAVSEQQLELNYRGIAVPLRDRNGQPVGALSVTMPIGFESTEDAAARVLPALNETAQAMRHLI
ncbi:MAG: transcriptional regulator, IclR family, partial [Polaromonas sp.]|nr:transcriptional regulator, IclR family [Polaromonas sp.]